MSFSRFIFVIFALSQIPLTAQSNQSCTDLWAKRNAIFAQRGYCFKSPEGRDLFSELGCETDHPRLSNREKREVQKLLQQEKRFHCIKFHTIPVKRRHYLINSSTSEWSTVYWQPSTHDWNENFILDNKERFISSVSTDESGKWIEISYDPGVGKEMHGWIEKRFLSPDPDPSYTNRLKNLKYKALLSLLASKNKRKNFSLFVQEYKKFLASNRNRFFHYTMSYKCHPSEKKSMYQCKVAVGDQDCTYDEESTLECGESSIWVDFQFMETQDGKINNLKILNIGVAG